MGSRIRGDECRIEYRPAHSRDQNGITCEQDERRRLGVLNQGSSVRPGIAVAAQKENSLYVLAKFCLI
jgi:hypothetical protein